MPDRINIQIRDQIATQIDAAGYTVYKSRTYALAKGTLPCVCVALGGSEIENESMDDLGEHEHEFALKIYVALSGDVDQAAMNILQTVEDAIKADTGLNGLADDAYLTTIAEPVHEKGETKHAMVEATLIVLFVE